MGKPEIRFKGYTDEWEQRKLGWLVKNKIIEAPKDGNHGEKHPTADEYVSEGIPFLMASDIRNGKAELEHCKHITKERAEMLDKGFAKEGDVLLTHKATIGEVAILKGLRDEYAMLTPQVTYYRILDNTRLARIYLYAVFNSNSFQNEMQTKAAQSTRPYIGISEQQNLTIAIPCSVEEQKKVGKYFSNLDHLITLHQRKPIPHPNHPTIHTKHKGEEKYVRIRVNDREKTNRTANLRRFPVDIPGGFKDGGGSVGEFQIYSGAE